VYLSAIAAGVVDPLIAGLAYHATSQIQILKDNLQHLSEYAEEEISKSEIKNDFEHQRLRAEIIYNSIRECINHHDSILEYVILL
jgi:hypothetical protein